jgi:hypothetical protein
MAQACWDVHAETAGRLREVKQEVERLSVDNPEEMQVFRGGLLGTL